MADFFETKEAAEDSVRLIKRRWGLWGFYFAVIFFSIPLVGFTVQEWRRISTFFQDARFFRSTGLVTSVSSWRGCPCTYQYTVGSDVFTGSANHCCQNPINSKIEIYVAEDNPKKSINEIPDEKSFWVGAIVSCILAIVMPIFARYNGARNSKAKITEFSEK